MKKDIKIQDISKPGTQLLDMDNSDLMPLPPPFDDPAREPDWKALTDQARESYEAITDNTLLVNIPKPKDKEEEQKYIRQFHSGPGRDADPDRLRRPAAGAQKAYKR